MNYVGRLLSNFKGFYNEINSATLTGAIDIVVVQQEDGTFLTSPWHVRFGKLGVLRCREKMVDVEVNGQPVADLHMKLGEAGEAFFVEEATDPQAVPAHLATSPLPNALELMEEGLKDLHLEADRVDICPEPTIIDINPELIDGISVPKSDRSEPDTFEEDLVTSIFEQIPSLETTIIDERSCLSGSSNISNEKNRKQETKIIVSETISDGTLDLKDSSSLFCPVLNMKLLSETGIQTDMTATEVETKATRSRISSTSSLDKSIKGTPPQNSDSKFPTFVRIDSDPDVVRNSVKERRRRRKKSAPSNIHDVPKTSEKSKTPQKIYNQEFISVGSTSSRDTQDEAMFDLELSGDELDNACVGVGRTVSMPMISHRRARTDEWASSQYAAALHPFSDSDLTPLVSPVCSRPPTPKSDTEYEITKYEATSQTQLTGDDLIAIDSVSWRWGELPENCTNIQIQPPLGNSKLQEEEKPSKGLFQFMRKTKKIRHRPGQEGIYLDDLNLDELDPEVAALYLYQTKGNCRNLHHLPEEDNDTESGRGASLPHSPLTVEGSTHMASSAPSSMSELSMSLCGGLKESDGMIPHEKFLQFLITYDEFCENPNVMSNPNLVIKMGEKYYNWQTAGPILMSVLAFQRPLPEQAVETLMKTHMPKKEAQRRRGWMWWGRSAGTENLENKDKSVGSNALSAPNTPQKPGKQDKKSKRQVKSDGSSSDDSDISQGASLKPLMIDANNDNTPRGVSVDTPMSLESVAVWHREYCKSLKLSSEKLESLNLQPGSNKVRFSVTTQYQGTSACSANIYLWKWDDKIIISDIDGTITKSDVLGQVLPMIGKDWSQVGIANLYNLIEKNGYRFLYLSARAIGQSKITRDYLKSIRQGALGLPDGPLLLSPSSLISAFHKEVIERRPQDFKISCLRDIKALFPSTSNPFYSGFGNKINDVWSYQAVNIPISRIFTVNHRGELKHEMTCTFQSTYTKMTDTVDHLFPPLQHHPKLGKITSGNFPEPEQFSNFTYWRDPLPDIQADIAVLLGKQTKSK